ncbi:MAG: phosphoribosylformylglycinamidine cyclo-ligase [Candidatus Omnitrophica bacterium CG11_big_fil_rev_8_21_14_0_20_42_13]|uniref:Phosphoribosylformylglycinamidine cyclo-ligase n=1 Tax=Candidatus Ghiorseimicrobium undicola TaxID=1974746 RepID=A0A2H0LZC1_9BACT|nr:MAG: phosphoribosylformylglycinamidine cyclo-ligase [Candidatus Omnitrophica bacterium CG11_big_fil_rev_8_21_14_0_20_42_13]
MKQLTYKKSGVDVKAANIFVQNIKKIVKSTQGRNVLANIGGFGGLFQFEAGKYKNPVLVSSTDGVGTKLKLAILANKHDTVGIDLVGMNVNDILCCGASPLLFLDYIACGKLNNSVLTDVVSGIAKGCRMSGCSLVGGETAEMPGMYKADDYDLAGFCLGVVERDKIIDGSNIRLKDTLIGIESNGLHSNGFSLVRKVFASGELKKYSAELLKPTRIYVKSILELLRVTSYELRVPVIKGIAHITGGAFFDKIIRVVPKKFGIKVYYDTWPVPDIFKLIQKKGKIASNEMLKTFNMGIGLVLVVDHKYTTLTIRRLFDLGLKSWAIGEIAANSGKVEIIN